MRVGSGCGGHSALFSSLVELGLQNEASCGPVIPFLADGSSADADDGTVVHDCVSSTTGPGSSVFAALAVASPPAVTSMACVAWVGGAASTGAPCWIATILGSRICFCIQLAIN